MQSSTNWLDSITKSGIWVILQRLFVFWTCFRARALFALIPLNIMSHSPPELAYEEKLKIMARPLRILWNAAQQIPDLHTGFIVLNRLMLDAVESNEPIFPLSQKALQRELHLNLRTIRRSLDLLEEHKLIQRNEKRTKVLVSCITKQKQLERLRQELVCPSSS